jgi:hypothetical protein
VVSAACWSSENPASRNCWRASCVSPGGGRGSPQLAWGGISSWLAWGRSTVSAHCIFLTAAWVTMRRRA